VVFGTIFSFRDEEEAYLMTKITIELQDGVAKRLGELAELHNMSPDDYAAEELTELILDPRAEMRRIAREVVRKNAELYRRLA
jgi:predicted transcriptional regulator